jgi:hypothetical protein
MSQCPVPKERRRIEFTVLPAVLSICTKAYMVDAPLASSEGDIGD